MAKRRTTTKRTSDGTSTAVESTSATAGAIEQRVLAFAEQLGRVAGTVQTRAEGWMDREALSKQLASVRDGAADLLRELARGALERVRKKPRAAARGQTKARSGGVVDAPGKKHRKRLPADPDATVASAQAAKMRAAMTMEKTSRRRARA